MPRKKNCHYHVPDVTVSLGQVLDLTVEHDGFRTTIDEFDGWQMLADENGFEHQPGHAKLFLIEGDLKRMQPVPEEMEQAAETYEEWNKREPEKMGELDTPDDIGYYQGRVIQLGYVSDKWNERGEEEPYDHLFTELGALPPKLYTDRPEIADSKAAIIVGGDFQITQRGID